MKIDYRKILISKYADKQWVLYGNSYDGLEWHDIADKPSQNILDNMWEEIKLEPSINEVLLDAKQSALLKLQKLGLTEEEARVIAGV